MPPPGCSTRTHSSRTAIRSAVESRGTALVVNTRSTVPTCTGSRFPPPTTNVIRVRHHRVRRTRRSVAPLVCRRGVLVRVATGVRQCRQRRRGRVGDRNGQAAIGKQPRVDAETDRRHKHCHHSRATQRSASVATKFEKRKAVWRSDNHDSRSSCTRYRSSQGRCFTSGKSSARGAGRGATCPGSCCRPSSESRHRFLGAQSESGLTTSDDSTCPFRSRSDGPFWRIRAQTSFQ